MCYQSIEHVYIMWPVSVYMCMYNTVFTLMDNKILLDISNKLIYYIKIYICFRICINYIYIYIYIYIYLKIYLFAKCMGLSIFYVHLKIFYIYM